MNIDVKSFTADVEVISETQHCSVIDAVLEWCERHSVEPELAAGAILKSPHLKARIQTEAENLNFIPKEGARLPL